jgi:hypothetical protein
LAKVNSSEGRRLTVVMIADQNADRRSFHRICAGVDDEPTF